MSRIMEKWRGWIRTKGFMARLSIYLCLIAVAWLCLGGFVQKGPYYRGRSLHWHWALDLQSNNASTRRQAAEALSDALTDDSLIVRRGAVHALVFEWEYPEETKMAVPGLIRAVQDNDEEERVIATKLLRRID